MKTGSDRRRYERVKIEMSAKVASGKKITVKGYTRDVSLKGFFLKCAAKPPVGGKCRVMLLFQHDKEEVPVKADGVVVRQEKEGVAVELTKVDMDSMTFVFWFFMVHELMRNKKSR